MIHFVGAGPGAEDLITVRGRRQIREADVIIYAGSLVNPALLKEAKKDCKIYNSAKMTLEEVTEVMKGAEEEGKTTVRLHTGDPSLYGAVREQMDILDRWGVAYDSCPGVSSFCGAAAALNLEYTLPQVSQSVIITRTEGRTAVPEKEKIQGFAAHQATMVLFLSTGLLKKLTRELLEGGYSPETPAAIVYKATWGVSAGQLFHTGLPPFLCCPSCCPSSYPLLSSVPFSCETSPGSLLKPGHRSDGRAVTVIQL